MMNEDYRKKWISERILTFVEESNEQLLNNLLIPTNDNAKLLDNLLQENIHSDIHCRVLIVYKTFYKTIVEEEIISQEGVQRQRSSLFSLHDNKKSGKKGKSKKKGKKLDKFQEEEAHVSLKDPINEDNLEQNYKTKNSKKKKKTALKKIDRNSPFTMVENLQNEQKEKLPPDSPFVAIKRTVRNVIELPQLHFVFGEIEEQYLDSENYYIYFIKKTNKRIPTFDDIQQANAGMPSFFTICRIPGNFMDSLKIILDSVFSPLLRIRTTAESETENETHSITKLIPNDNCKSTSLKKPSEFFLKKNYGDKNGSIKLLNDEEQSQLQNEFLLLRNSLKCASKELNEHKSEFMKILPCFHECLHETDTHDDNINNNIAETLNQWNETLVSFLSTLNESSSFSLLLTTNSQENLLTEYFHWKECEMKTAAILDVLDDFRNQKILSKFENDEGDRAGLCRDIRDRRDNLQQKFSEFSEHAEVLRIHMNFFKIFMNDDFNSITMAIPRFIESLRSVWVLSTYYNQEKNMLRILLNVKTTLCNRVETEFNVTRLFRQDWNNLEGKLESARNMLKMWRLSYLENRNCIETNRKFFIPRWEFNKSDLFSETEYIATVIEDMKGVLKTSKQFKDLFEFGGLEKLPKCSSECVNIRNKMECLTIPIEKADFDVYKEIFRDEWQEVLDIFQQSVTELDQNLKILIINAFSQIKLLKENIEIVKRISKIKTRPTIYGSLPYICNKIVLCFAKQIKLSTQMFDKQKVKKYNPFRIYDNIFPVENLLSSLNHQIRKLKCMMETVSITTPAYEEALDNYGNLKQRIEQFLESTFKTWYCDVTHLLNQTLNECIMEIREIESLQIGDQQKSENIRTSGNATDTITTCFGRLTQSPKYILKNKSSETKCPNLHNKKLNEPKIGAQNAYDQSLLIENSCIFQIKMKQEVFDVFESYNQMPDIFKGEEKFSNLSNTLGFLGQQIITVNDVVKKYNDIALSLRPEKVSLTRKYLFEVEKLLLPGTTHLTWKYSTMDMYCKNITQKCNQLECLVYQMNKVFNKLNLLVDQMKTIHFFPVQYFTDECFEYEDFFRNIQLLQKNNVEECFTIYKTISHTMILLECLVLRNRSGCTLHMKHIYDFYKNEIIQAIKESVLNSLSNLKDLFDGEFSIRFKIECFLEQGKIKLRPTCDEIFETIKILLIQCFLKLKHLKLWHPNTAIIIQKSDKLIIDVITQDEKVQSLVSKVFESLQQLCNLLTNSLERWSKYSILWKYDKDKTVTRFHAEEHPSFSQYEMIYNFYTDISCKIEEESTTLKLRCIDIDSHKLINQLKEHCNEWKFKLSTQLAISTEKITSSLFDRIPRFESTLNSEITNIYKLTEVLSCINEIQGMSIDVELQIYEIKEHYHELRMQNYKIQAESFEKFQKLEASWLKLYSKCLLRKYSLETLQQQASTNMNSRIEKFKRRFEKFTQEFTDEFSEFKSYTFDFKIQWILKFVKKYSELEKQQNELIFMCTCYEVVFPDTPRYLDLGRKIQQLKTEYKIFT